MYITKLVYVESGDVPEQLWEELKAMNLIQFTDYDTLEITKDNYDNFKENMTNEPDEYEKTWEGLRQELIDCCGSDVIEALEKDEIDLIMFV